MDNYKDLLAQSSKLYEGVKAILNNPEATAEDKGKVEAMLKDAGELKAKAIQLKDIGDSLADIALKVEEKQGPDESKEERKDPKQFKDWIEFLEAAWWANHPKNHKGPDPRLVSFKDELEPGHEKKDLAENVGATGGFLVPVEFLAQLQSVIGENSIVQPLATVIRMKRRQVQLPVLDQTGTTAGVPHWFGGISFYYGEEGAEKTESDPNFRLVTLSAHKLYGYTRSSDELMEDSAISLADFFSGPLGFAGGIAWWRDYMFLRGNGAGVPLGIINAGCTISVAAQANPPAAASLFTDLVNMLEAFLPSGRGMWVLNQRHLSDVALMNGPAASPSYLWGNAVAGLPMTILGMPYKFTEKLPVPGSAGSILLMDARYYLVGDRQSTTVETTKFDRWRYDETSWRVVDRHDGQPWLAAPLTLQDGTTQISPFVILGAKST